MFNKLIVVLLAAACVSRVALSATDDPSTRKHNKPESSPAASLSSIDQRDLELGRKVHAVSKAIKNPRAPDAMDAITDLGRDQRYYVMVRGWLSYQLQGDNSILDANGDRTSQHVRDRIAFVEQAIRAIDLE